MMIKEYVKHHLLLFVRDNNQDLLHLKYQGLLTQMLLFLHCNYLQENHVFKSRLQGNI
jgi:hypothetical protein